MIDIKIYGTGSSAQQLAKTKLTTCLSMAGMEYHLKEVTNIQEIMDNQIQYIPSIKANELSPFELKQNGQYSQSLREAIQKILQIENYGKMTKIIVPTDFSDASNNAYNFAHHLSKDIQGVLQIAHIYYPTSTDVNQFVVINEEAEKIHRKKLDDFVAGVNRDWIGTFIKEPFVEGVFKVGFPRAELSEMSKQPGTIMVMGTTGAGDTFKKVFGSLSLDMTDHCYCPLFLIPPEAGYAKITEIVYLSEDLKNDVMHLLYIGRLCLKINADLRIVHYRTKDDDNFDVTDSIKIIESYFPELKYHIDISDTKDIFESIKSLIKEDTNHLVAVSTKHRNIFQNLFHKSVTEFAALNSDCPLLILSDRTSEANLQ